ISPLNMIDVITPVTIDAEIRVKSNLYLQLYYEYDKYCPIPPSFLRPFELSYRSANFPTT
ncbi:MAG: hypothetical protein WAL79_04115, partial [Nitrososphaeraceae archaeon]